MICKVFLVVFLAVASARTMSYEDIWTKIVGGAAIPQDATPFEQFSSFYTDAMSWLKREGIDLGSRPVIPDPSNPYPYFGFIPYFRGTVKPDGKIVSFPTRCFSKGGEAFAQQTSSDTYTITFNFKGTHIPGCFDFFWIADLESGMFPEWNSNGTHVLEWTVSQNASSAAIYDIGATGFRIMEFNAGREQTLLNLVDTLLLFECFFTPDVNADCDQRNYYFMQKYSGFTMANRTSGVVTLNESDIHDGDFFGVLRLDGVDPMLAWAMGSTTGHTTTALRIDGVLHVCESTTVDAYWPTNGVQCTEWNTWIQQCQDADMNIVHAPLAASYRDAYDSQAALEFFQEHKGVDYGWYNLLYGWVDTEEANYPCVPPYPSQQCLVWGTVEVLMATLERLSESFVDQIFNQAMNIRLGTSGLHVAELMQTADMKGIPRSQLPTIVEEDTFIYNTTQDGVPVQSMSMVCCVFVCEMWKHGGVFKGVNNEINCAEFTNWDDYTMTIFDTTTPRPSQCVTADPNNPLCQLMGKYELYLNDYATKDQYPHMAERCPSQANNNYTKPPDC